MQGEPAQTIDLVSTDTRTIRAGALFVALVGERFDAHNFLEQAAEKGASALLVSRAPSSPMDGVAVIQVTDTLVGLQTFAKAYRKQLDVKSVVITGSNGKTSTKDMVLAVLGSRFRTTATLGNLNNHIGLPLTVLSTEGNTEFGVWEIGMNHPGEIAPLADIAAPDIGIITNIGTAHIGNMGSREAIASEKGMLAEAMTAEGTLLLNTDDDFTSAIKERTLATTLMCGIEAGDVMATKLEIQDQGMGFVLSRDGDSAKVSLPLLGHHMVSNALLAAGAGMVVGMTVPEIAEALSAVELTPGRLQELRVGGVRVINDAYNANPDSMRASLSTVGAIKLQGKSFAILGQMGELGAESEQAHHEIGRQAVTEGFDHVCSVGEGARGFTENLSPHSHQIIHHFDSHQEAAAFLTQTTVTGDLVLLKGSRGAAMETILQHFAAESE